MKKKSHKVYDIYGQALYDYFQHGEADKLILHTSYERVEEMPVDWFFRDEEDFPPLEMKALEACQGKILDIGAGVGSHAVYLHEMGKEVHCLDQSPLCVAIMKARGLKPVYQQSLWESLPHRYDTLLMLMNGIGIVGKIEGLRKFLQMANSLLLSDGQIIFDSSDLSYLYTDIRQSYNPYKGEISYQYEYKGMKDQWFSWLYVDPVTMQKIAEEEGWSMRILAEDHNDQYLGKLKKL
ncbi:SAM-dependent methyltransferase [Catalinimonas sp. 4WD22]|uniref:class I SAM-dependent methyltransferase n=1 Tax=Catalinimonas locisalis TaxID=3133978 RepID=UPI0031015194